MAFDEKVSHQVSFDHSLLVSTIKPVWTKLWQFSSTSTPTGWTSKQQFFNNIPMCYCVSACKANCVNYYSVGYNFAKNSSNHNSSNVKMSSNNKNTSNMSGLNTSSTTSNKYGTGQLISEWLFDVLNFPKNQHKNLMNFCPRN